MIATAREHLAERAGRTIALLSVASTAGIGVGYPLAGLLTEVAGVRAAYALGLAVTAAALAAALLALPTDDPPGPPGRSTGQGPACSAAAWWRCCWSPATPTCG